MATCRCGAEFGGKIEHCTVSSCHQSFTGTTAGDMHRVGDHALSTGPNRRRCLSETEMLAKGMAQNARGIWMSVPSGSFEHFGVTLKTTKTAPVGS